MGRNQKLCLIFYCFSIALGCHQGVRPSASPLSAAAPATWPLSADDLLYSASQATTTNTATDAGPIPAPHFLCTAKLQRAFRLLDQRESDARAVLYPGPASVELLYPEVLYSDELFYPAVHKAQMFRVRVLADSKLGYLYVQPEEIDPKCPIIWPHVASSSPLSKKDQRPISKYPDSAASDLGLSGDTWPVHQQTDVKQALYVHELRIVREWRDSEYSPSEPGDYLILALGSPQGWTATVLGFCNESGVVLCIKSNLVIAGPAVYVHVTFPKSGSRANEHELYRVTKGGAVRMVMTASLRNDLQETWTFVGQPDGSLCLRNSKGREQILRWDAAQWRLRPESYSRPKTE